MWTHLHKYWEGDAVQKNLVNVRLLLSQLSFWDMSLAMVELNLDQKKSNLCLRQSVPKQKSKFALLLDWQTIIANSSLILQQ